MMYHHTLTAFILNWIILDSCQGSLEVTRDETLMELIKNDKYIVALFSARNCETCDDFENELLNVKEDLANNLNAAVVKVVDSQLTRLYSPSKEPALVFFRHGVPLLYSGHANGEMIFHIFSNNKEPVVKELTDETFEHLTQAATGATTGDWFIMFYAPDCVDCHRLGARWEAVGAQLKTRMNVARMNKATNGAATAKRFGVLQVPAFILFRQGRLYRYKIQKYDVPSFISFAQDWYKNITPERVPLPKSPFDELIQAAVDFLQSNPLLWQISFSVVLLGFLIFLLTKCFSKQTKVKQRSGKVTEKER